MIKTFIFLDLETTDLIKKTLPKITELSLIAVSRNAICETMDPLPRVLHKLILPIHPNTNISEKIFTLTGLSNKNLEGVQYFNCEVYNLIMSFIDRQIKPVCFVAHNGNRFDYPIFLSEFKHINKNFSKDVLSIDMLHLCQDFFSFKDRDVQTTPSTSNTENVHNLLHDDNDEILCNALDSVMNSVSNKHNKNNKNKESSICSENVVSTSETSCYEKIQKINEKTPESQIIKLQNTEKSLYNRKESTARRRLHFTGDKPVNFKLISIYQHIFGTTPENAHCAEGDCLTMIRCAIKLGNYFVTWADSKAVPLVNYEKI